MRLLWVVLLGVFRSMYFAYALWCVTFPVALVYLWRHHRPWVLWPGVAVWVVLVAVVYARNRESTRGADPWQAGFLAWFGTLRVFRNLNAGPKVALTLPSSFLVENPAAYGIRGEWLDKFVDSVVPGDILVRGFDGYVDGFFIRMASEGASGHAQGHRSWFTHIGLYVGPLDESDRARVPEGHRVNKDFFTTGKRKVIHALSQGVHTEDLLSFVRCDHLAVLRLPVDTPDRDRVITTAITRALAAIGTPYNFDSTLVQDATDTRRYSCSELVYHCFEETMHEFGLEPTEHALYPLSNLGIRVGFFKRVTIIPDDFYQLALEGRMIQGVQDEASERTGKARRTFQQARATT
jgi:hypothetical protein